MPDEINILGLAFALSVIVVGAFLLILSLAPRSERVEAILNGPDTLRSLFSILFPKTGHYSVVDATEMTYTLRLPCRSGWFWYAGKPKRCTLFFAPIPLGFICKLPGVDSVTNRRFTDTSSLCLVKDLGGAEVGSNSEGSGHTTIELLQRCRRWQILVHGGDGWQVKTQQDILIRAHVAVHTRIELDVSDSNVAIVFSDYLNYVRAVESLVVRTLRRLASLNTYSWLVINTEVIINELNKEWALYIAGKVEEQVPTPSCRLVDTFFSGVVIKLYLEQEEARLQKTLTNRFSVPERQYKDLVDEFEVWGASLRADLNDTMGKLNNLITMFTGLADGKGISSVGQIDFDADAGGGFQGRLQKHLESNARSMQNQRDPDEFLRAARELVPRLKVDLVQQCDDIVKYANHFRDVIANLKNQEIQCERINQSPFDAEINK
jgi:hypothetical protein